QGSSSWAQQALARGGDCGLFQQLGLSRKPEERVLFSLNTSVCLLWDTFSFCLSFFLSVSLSPSHKDTHTHTHITRHRHTDKTTAHPMLTYDNRYKRIHYILIDISHSRQ